MRAKGLAQCAKGAAICAASVAMSATAELTIAELRGIVARAVEPHRDRGMKAAWHAAARQLGITARRVRAYLAGEVRSVTAWEAEQLRAREAEILALEEQRTAARLAAVRARLAAIRGDDDPTIGGGARTGAEGVPCVAR